jgi:uroporphyrin-III C-methyltransferase
MIETIETRQTEESYGWAEAHQQGDCSSQGIVYLIGAGPGDPELMTLKGLRYLRTADVVLYDRLIGNELLDETKPEATLIFVGKGPHCHTMKQEEINALLIHHAQQNRIVVRLKGGDPFVFGRGGEEAIALAEAGIPFEIVPGVSSAIAVPAYAGIPVTHRDHVSSITIVTGHESEHNHATPINWQALANTGGTLVILMGIKGLPAIRQNLIAAGLSSNTPAAVIQEGTTDKQRVVTGILANIAERVAEAKLTSPAVIVIGTVVELNKTLAWYQTSGKNAYLL